jgi:hypothetical protein
MSFSCLSGHTLEIAHVGDGEWCAIEFQVINNCRFARRLIVNKEKLKCKLKFFALIKYLIK